MKRRLKQISILGAIVLFLFSLAPEEVESRRRSSGRSYSRSSSRRSSSAPRRSSRSYSGSRTTRKTSTSTRSGSSRSRSYGRTRSTSPRTRSGRTSSVARQRQTATNRARVTRTTPTRKSTPTKSSVANRKSTRKQQRQAKLQDRKQVRQLRSENRRLKRENRRADRRTARDRRNARSTINVNNFGGYYPMAGYSMYSLGASMAFNNLMFGIYFHDYYNHAIRHSYMWHYHHRDYDRSHWDAAKQAEYEYYNEYYESQGIEPNPNYVDPGTNRDEDYVASYVKENSNEFYGKDAEVFTVDELPDEAALKKEILAVMTATGTTVTEERAPPVPQKVIIERKTSGATWFILIFGGCLIIGTICVVMYNKGYF